MLTNSEYTTTSPDAPVVTEEALSDAATSPSLKRLSLAQVLNRPRPQIRHVVPGLLPGMVGAIAGPGGAGKTMLKLQMSVAYALGLPPLGGLFPAPRKPYRVVLISGEETGLTCANRLHDIIDDLLAMLPTGAAPGVRCDYISLLEQNFDLYPASGIDIALVRHGQRTDRLDALRSLIEGRDLAFIETVSRLHSGDENSATDMAAVVSSAEWLARTTGSAIVLGHHVSKAAEYQGFSDSAAAARGSSAFVDDIRWLANIFEMSKDDAAKRDISGNVRKSFLRFEVTKSNHASPSGEKWLRRGLGGVLQLIPTPVSARTGRGSSAIGKTREMRYV